MLCAVLLLAQQHLRVHPLSHLHERATATHAHTAGQDLFPEHDAGPCALCLSVAASASFAPAGAGLLALPPTVGRPAVARAAADTPRRTSTTRFIRGPPAAITYLG